MLTSRLYANFMLCFEKCLEIDHNKCNSAHTALIKACSGVSSLNLNLTSIR